MADREPPVRRRPSPEDASNLLVGALTPEEMELCQNVVVFGVEYLRSAKGWTAEAASDFLKRVQVRRHIETLQKQYTDRTGIQERTQFFAQLKINAMVPAAINTLAKALRGAFTDPSTGNVVPPPSRGQLDAACEVLNRANIQGSKWGGNDSVPLVDARSVQVALGGGSADPLNGLGGESREKLRSLLAAVTSRARSIAAAPSRPRRAAEPEGAEAEPDDGAERDHG